MGLDFFGGGLLSPEDTVISQTLAFTLKISFRPGPKGIKVLVYTSKMINV
jgi:hypothetical protein